jgi:hypothetical protein
MKLLFFFLLIFSTTCSFAQTSEKDLRHSIQITLLSRYNRTPFANETVQLFTRKKRQLVQELKTDQGGKVQFTDLKKGHYVVLMTASDGTEFWQPYTVPSAYEDNSEYVLDLSSEQKLKLMGNFVLNGDSLRLAIKNRVPKSSESSGTNNAELSQFKKELMQKVVYPQNCVDDGIEGKVILYFITDKEGKILNAGVIVEAHPDFDVEGLFSLFLMEKINVKSMLIEEQNRFTLPLTFSFT